VAAPLQNSHEHLPDLKQLCSFRRANLRKERLLARGGMGMAELVLVHSAGRAALALCPAPGPSSRGEGVGAGENNSLVNKWEHHGGVCFLFCPPLFFFTC